MGRIGSWFSPWKAQNPKDPETENATATCELPPGPDTGAGEEERAEPVREPWAGWQREEGTLSSDPERPRLSRDIFSSEKQDATQSAHKGSPFVSTDWEPAERGPKEEEFLDAREFLEGRRGQGWEREGSSINSAPVTGALTLENASQLTHPSCTRVQGVVGKADTLHTQVQRKAHAPAGKELHVYLEEESSVINSGDLTGAGQDVVRTRLNKSFHVIAKTKSLDVLDSPRYSDQEQPEIRTSPPRSAQSRFSAPADLAFTQPSDTHGAKPEPESEEAESTRMGRKNTSRRKSKKQSPGDMESNSRENTPSKAEDVTGSPSMSGGTLTSAQAPGVETHLGEPAGNSTSTQSLSEGGKNKTPTAIQTEIPSGKQSKGYNGPDSTSPTDTTGTAVDREADMEDDYKLERKTETPESKRRSMKVSRSEVKIFPKKVLVNADQQSGPGSGNVSQNFRSGLSKPQDAIMDNSKNEVSTG